MGILDFLNPQDPMKQQSLLAAAAAMLQASGPSRTPTSFGQALGGGIGAYQQSQDQQRQLQQQQALRDLQIKAAQGELDDQGLTRQRKQAMYDAAGASNVTPEQQAMSGGGGPTLANAAKIPTSKGGFDLEGFTNRMMAIDPMQGIALMQSLKKAGPKFDSGITWVNGPDGRPMAVRTADDGSMKQIDGVAPREKMELANLGGKDVAYNPFGLQAGQTFQRTMTPDGAAADRRAGERLNFDKSQVGKPVFNAEAGGWILPPSADNPGGKLMPVAGIAGKAPTEFQGKSAAYGLRATEANKTIGALEGQYSPAGVNAKNALGSVWGVGGMLSSGANAMLSDSSQLADQAQRDFINAILRQESGASIGASEFDNAAKQYFSQPGDSEPVKAQKARNRALAIQGLQANAGKAALTAPAAPGSWSITKVE